MKEHHPVIDAAIAAATRRFLAGSSIDMSGLADELGISRATLYRHVSNYEQLMGLVLEQQTETTFAHTASGVGLTGVDAVIGRLDAFMRSVVSSVPLRSFIARDPVLFMRVVMGPGLVEEAASRAIEGMLHAETPTGLALPADEMARTIVRVCDSLMYSPLLNGTEPDLNAAVAVIDVLLGAAEPLGAARGDAGRGDRRVDAASDTDTDAPDAPPTARGRRTRARLLTAARVVFERVGLAAARLADIAAEAGCAIGTIYTYFPDKEALFVEVIQAIEEEMMHPDTGGAEKPADDPFMVIEASNRSYFESYRRNARMLIALEQAAHFDERYRELRRRRSSRFIQRNARSIRDLQARGIADPELDPVAAARALSGMISRLAYGNYAWPDGEDSLGAVSTEELVATATRLWTGALGMRREPVAQRLEL